MKLLLALFLFAYASAYDTYPHPELDQREVIFDKSTYGLMEMVKRGVIKGLINPNYGGQDELHIGTCAPEKEPDAWKFLGNTEASLSTENPKATWENYCFTKNTVEFKWIDDMTAEVVLHASGKKSLLCTDSYLISTLVNFDMKIVKTEGRHVVTYKFEDANEALIAKNMGLKVVKFCDHWYNILPDFLMTLRFFIVDILTMKLDIDLPASWYEKMYDNHYRFLHRWEGLKLVEREPKVLLGPDFFERNAQSGDIMCRYAGSGTSSMILWATGAQCSHIAVYMWGKVGTPDQGQLFVLQSNENGIWKQPIADFWADNQNTTTVLLPLAANYRAKFDLNKAWEWFETVNGLPYGIHNMFFTFLDTPENNWPQTVSSDSWFTFMNILNKVVPSKAGEEGPADKIMGAALNHRLGTQGLSMPEIVLEAAKRGLSMGELISMPEQEGWLYDGHPNYVCCAFAAGLWYHGGLFGDMTILPNEFTNEDIFSIKVYDENYTLPTECQQNDPELPFCVTSGIYKVDPRNYNKVAPYSHMNEACPSKAPFYRRPERC
jgi:hypothetical protein